MKNIFKIMSVIIITFLCLSCDLLNSNFSFKVYNGTSSTILYNINDDIHGYLDSGDSDSFENIEAGDYSIFIVHKNDYNTTEFSIDSSNLHYVTLEIISSDDIEITSSFLP